MFSHPVILFLLLAAAFIGGIAFYKHRKRVKQLAQNEVSQAKQYIANEAQKAEAAVKSRI